MPKLKSNSSAKKRFSFTGTGKVRMNPANKRHGLVKRPQQMKRQTRGTQILGESDAVIVKRYLLPYGDKFQK
jgi:large subunit ribosomal protein L35